MPYYTFTDVKLPVGFNYKGTWYNTVQAREWTGGDNQHLVSAEARQNPSKGINSFLTNIVSRIYNSQTNEEITKITRDMFSEMYVRDRDMIVLETRKLTFGNNLPIQYTCDSCRQQNSFDFDLNTIEVKYKDNFPPDVEFYVTLEHGIPSPATISEPEGAEVFKNITLTYLKGKDEERIVQAGKINASRAQAAVAFASIKDIPGYDMSRLSPGLIDKMKSVDYRDLFAAISANQIGPDLIVEVACYNCEAVVNLPLARLLFTMS